MESWPKVPQLATRQHTWAHHNGTNQDITRCIFGICFSSLLLFLAFSTLILFYFLLFYLMACLIPSCSCFNYFLISLSSCLFPSPLFLSYFPLLFVNCFFPLTLFFCRLFSYLPFLSLVSFPPYPSFLSFPFNLWLRPCFLLLVPLLSKYLRFYNYLTWHWCRSAPLACTLGTVRQSDMVPSDQRAGGRRECSPVVIHLSWAASTLPHDASKQTTAKQDRCIGFKMRTAECWAMRPGNTAMSLSWCCDTCEARREGKHLELHFNIYLGSLIALRLCWDWQTVAGVNNYSLIGGPIRQQRDGGIPPLN
jgi:hypothetical protein